MGPGRPPTALGRRNVRPKLTRGFPSCGPSAICKPLSSQHPPRGAVTHRPAKLTCSQKAGPAGSPPSFWLACGGPSL